MINHQDVKSTLSKILHYLKFFLEKTVYYLNSAPVNWRDPWIWFCLTVSCLVLTYLNLKALMLLIGEFLCIFTLIEGVSTRFDFFNYKWNVEVDGQHSYLYVNLWYNLMSQRDDVYCSGRFCRDLHRVLELDFNGSYCVQYFQHKLSFSIAPNNTASCSITCVYLCTVLAHAWKTHLFSDSTRAAPVLGHTLHASKQYRSTK